MQCGVYLRMIRFRGAGYFFRWGWELFLKNGEGGDLMLTIHEGE